ncbi:MAG: hypothetical protein ACTS44_00455 [Candidatus Hodgkinia cicadicola]
MHSLLRSPKLISPFPTSPLLRFGFTFTAEVPPPEGAQHFQSAPSEVPWGTFNKFPNNLLFWLRLRRSLPSTEGRSILLWRFKLQPEVCNAQRRFLRSLYERFLQAICPKSICLRLSTSERHLLRMWHPKHFFMAFGVLSSQTQRSKRSVGRYFRFALPNNYPILGLRRPYMTYSPILQLRSH